MRVSEKICETCGSILDVEAPSGFCAACLIAAALNCHSEDGDFSGASIADYQILSEIARGGMGIVYRARQRTPDRVVALKMILPSHIGSPDALIRFRGETEAAASLDHECILPIYAVGEQDGAPFYSMKFAEGGGLAVRLSDFKDKPRGAALLITKLARAVAHAHEHGIVHRDLKPGNVLFDAAGKPFVSDFGLAKWLEREGDLTQTLAIVGTPYYMAPEQAAGENRLTNAADIYSLGAILFHLVTGCPPFLGDNAMEVLRKAAERSPPRPRDLNSRIPQDLETICLKCLEKNPELRYRSAAALADDLERFAAGRVILARRASPAKRFWRWMKRNPVVAGLGAAAVALVISLLFVLLHPIAAPIPTKSVAVLPFENRSEDKSNSYFADGIQDEILTRLSKIADLKVISHTSTQHYKSAPQDLARVAGQLGVAYILEGNVQKSGDAVRLNVQLIEAANAFNVWAETFDRKLIDIFSVETEVAQAIADQLQAHVTGAEKRIIEAKPTANVEAYDAYLRGLAYVLKPSSSTANALRAQKHFQEAVRLDPRFAQAWAQLSIADALGYFQQYLQPTAALREEARHAADTAAALQPNLGEALLAKGYYHYACLRDYDNAVRYFEQARQFLPNSSEIPESLAYVTRRRGQWDQSEFYFNEAERLDPRSAVLLAEHASSYKMLRRFPEALRKLDQVLDLVPDDAETIMEMAGIVQAEGDLPRASGLLAPLRPGPTDTTLLETQTYQAILERRPEPMIAQLKGILAEANPTLGFYKGELRFWLGWAQEVGGDRAAANETWRTARSELESFLPEQPENYRLIGDLALVTVGLADNAAALALAERAMTVMPVEKDVVIGGGPIEILTRVSARMGDADRAIAALQKLLPLPSRQALAEGPPLTPALLRLDPMFDPLRSDPRFQKLVAGLEQKLVYR